MAAGLELLALLGQLLPRHLQLFEGRCQFLKGLGEQHLVLVGQGFGALGQGMDPVGRLLDALVEELAALRRFPGPRLLLFRHIQSSSMDRTEPRGSRLAPVLVMVTRHLNGFPLRSTASRVSLLTDPTPLRVAWM